MLDLGEVGARLRRLVSYGQVTQSLRNRFTQGSLAVARKEHDHITIVQSMYMYHSLISLLSEFADDGPYMVVCIRITCI